MKGSACTMGGMVGVGGVVLSRAQAQMREAMEAEAKEQQRADAEARAQLQASWAKQAGSVGHTTQANIGPATTGGAPAYGGHMCVPNGPAMAGGAPPASGGGMPAAGL